MNGLKDQYFMRQAIEKARAGINKGQTPFGACVVKGGQIISCEHNAVWKTTDITAHAEIRAIRRACTKLNTIDLSSCVMYSTCEPCPMCFSACHWARIKRIVFGTKIADAKRFGFNELPISGQRLKSLSGSTMILQSPVLKTENTALFQEWASLNKSPAY